MKTKHDLGWLEFIFLCRGENIVPAISSVVHTGIVYSVGERVYCEDAMYSGSQHVRVSGKITGFQVDPFDPSKTLAVLDRDDGFSSVPNVGWFVRLQYCTHQPEAEPLVQVETKPVNKGYVPDTLENFSVVGPNGRLL